MILFDDDDQPVANENRTSRCKLAFLGHQTDIRAYMYPSAFQMNGLVVFDETSNPFCRIIFSERKQTEILCGGHGGLEGSALNSMVAPKNISNEYE